MADYTKIIKFIKDKEGGLSSATTDTAHKNPSNCGNGKNGRPYHTNKGVTWGAFKGLSSKLGYSASCKIFLEMPDNIWGLIYKDGFWNPMQGDRIKNQAIANTFVEMAWMSGVENIEKKRGAVIYLKKFFYNFYDKNLNNITEIVDYVNELEDNGGTPALFEHLFDFRSNLYASFKQPRNLVGWYNRLDSFYLENKIYAMTTEKNIDYDKMTNKELVEYLDKLDKATFNGYVNADTKVRYFVDKFGQSFIKAVKGTGLFVTGIIAQAIYESGYGRNIPTDKVTGAISNNFAGIKYNPSLHDGYVVSDTSEIVKGKKVIVPNTKFAKFKDPTEGIIKHLELLMKDRYKNARLNAKSPEEQIKMFVQAGYSTMNPTAYVNQMKGNISRVRKLLPFGRII